MKRILAAIAIIMTLCGAAFALSDEEYLAMKEASSDFAKAEKRLNDTWKSLKASMKKQHFKILQEEQREWLDGWRDEDARMYMEKGYSRIEAYTMATNERTKYLKTRAAYIRKHGE